MVWVLPSTRTWTFAAEAAAGRTSERTSSATRRLATNPPSARGSVWRATGRSSDSGLPLHRLPGICASATPSGSWWRASPLTAAGPSRTCTGFPFRSPVCRASLASGLQPPVQALAVDLDVLGDVGPLWQAWLEDAARRARVAELDAARLDEQLPNWRALLQHFAEDHAPVYLRPSAPVTTALAAAAGRRGGDRRLHRVSRGARAARARAPGSGAAGRRAGVRRGRRGAAAGCCSGRRGLSVRLRARFVGVEQGPVADRQLEAL